MAKKTDKPRTGQPLDQIKLDDIGLPEPFVGVLVDQLELKTMDDIQRVTKGGNDWEFVTNGITEHGKEVPRDTLDDGLITLKDKYTLAIKNAPEAATATSPKKKPKPAEPEYIASYGKGKYEYELSASIVGRASAEDRGPESRESYCGVTCSVPLNSGNGTGVIDPARALDYFHDVKLDVMICVADAKQGSLDGMEDERKPCYGIAEIGGPKFDKEHITFPIKFKGRIDQINLTHWAKSEITLRFNIIEKYGQQTKRAKTNKPDADPAQGKLADAA